MIAKKVVCMVMRGVLALDPILKTKEEILDKVPTHCRLPSFTQVGVGARGQDRVSVGHNSSI